MDLYTDGLRDGQDLAKPFPTIEADGEYVEGCLRDRIQQDRERQRSRRRADLEAPLLEQHCAGHCEDSSVRMAPVLQAPGSDVPIRADFRPFTVDALQPSERPSWSSHVCGG
jgi:hypothetical protein